MTMRCPRKSAGADSVVAASSSTACTGPEFGSGPPPPSPPKQTQSQSSYGTVPRPHGAGIIWFEDLACVEGPTPAPGPATVASDEMEERGEMDRLVGLSQNRQDTAHVNRAELRPSAAGVAKAVAEGRFGRISECEWAPGQMMNIRRAIAVPRSRCW